MAKSDKTKPKEWRETIRKRMFKATKEEAVGRYKTGYPAFNYRWEHVQTVVRLAIRLAEETGADVEVVEAAAWLHDVAKYTAKQKHPQKGAEQARKILAKTDFPPEKIERVAQAIESHMGLWRKTPLANLEAAILWDADKLTKIGLTGAFHWLGDTLTQGRPMQTTEMIERGHATNWQERTVASMHTEPARQAAAERLRRYRALWRELEAEIHGDDLG